MDRLDRLRQRHGRRAAIVVLALFGALIVHNAAIAVRNQRTLAKGNVGIDDWFHTSSTDLTEVALDHRRWTVRDRIAVFYAIRDRIGGAHLRISRDLRRFEWELRHVARLALTIHRGPLRVDERHVEGLRARGERFRFEAGTRRRRNGVWLYVVRGEGVRDYVLVGSAPGDLFVLPEAELVALEGR